LPPVNALQLSLILWLGVENGERKRLSFGVWNHGDSTEAVRVYGDGRNRTKANKLGICLKIAHIAGSTA
jgi:hypothetical protein